MSFQKGQPRPKNAGRRKGTPNKETYARRIAEDKALDTIKKEILKDFMPLIQAKKNLALGIFVEKELCAIIIIKPGVTPCPLTSPIANHRLPALSNIMS